MCRQSASERPPRAQQRCDRSVSQVVAPGLFEVTDGALGNCGDRLDPRQRTWCIRRKAVARSRPEREVSPCRVSTRHDTVCVDLPQFPEVVDRGSDVLERSRPAAAFLPDPPVLDVPRCDTATGQVDRQGRHERSIPARPPEPAVEKDDARPRPTVPRGQVEVRDLIVVPTVRHAGRRRHLVRHRHDRQARSAGCRPSASSRTSTSRSVL